MGSEKKWYSVSSLPNTEYRILFKYTLIVLSTLIILRLLALPVAAQSVTTDDVNAVARGLYCPVCESEPLDTCQTQACADWREEIRMQLEEGSTKEDVHRYFRARYGDRVLAQPPADGFNLVLWVGLPLFVILGGMGFGRYLRTIRQTKPVTASIDTRDTAEKSGSDATDEYVRRIEEELAKKP